MTLLLCGLAGFFITQAVKILYPLKLQPRAKMAWALLGSAGVSAALYTHKASDLVIYAVAGAGLAVLTHRFARLASVAGDWCIREIISKRPRG